MIDVVIIGINSEKTLATCIQTVLNSYFPQDQLNLFYVDGGSKDKSVAIAKQFPQVRTIELHPARPTPGLGRNTGWRAGTGEYVQFLDSDTELDPNWLEKAVTILKENPQVAAVRGLRREKHPEQSVYNWIIDQEWNDAPGECSCFGGDVMIRRKVLEQTGGYNDSLVGGEDPELSLRVRQKGWKIEMLDAMQTRHDLAMHSFKQYWKRAYRTGYAYVEVYGMHRHESQFWRRELVRIIVRGGGGLFCLVLAFIGCWAWLIPAAVLLFYPMLKVGRLGFAYALHCSLVVVPQFFGVAGALLAKGFFRDR